MSRLWCLGVGAALGIHACSVSPWVAQAAVSAARETAESSALGPHTTLAYTAYPNHDCNQDDAECEPFASCRDANGTCVKCCDPATDGEVGCLRKLEAACNSNAVPFGKSSAFNCIGFGYAPPGNPGLLKQVRVTECG